ncbi:MULTISPECIES: hypothetical protein [unclassified Streptomyces]|uniref:hypothetical protein n=1 Tax=unclassified Streptomyces TaxID=2593676 RepID=UPI0037F64F21
MNTMTAEPTESGVQEVAVPDQHAPAIRVSIREIREYAYRALVGAGAVPGEATTAAGQVLHAELHSGDGLEGLASDLVRGRWSRAGLTCTRPAAGRRVLDVDCGGRSGELRIGAPIVGLVAGESGPAIAVTSADAAVTSLLDDVLLAAAVTARTEVTALRAREDGAYAVRHATSGGDLAHGVLGPADIPFLPEVGEWAESRPLIVLTSADSGFTSARLAWSTRTERTERRRLAALHGVRADEATWRVVAAYARCFLVPEGES